MVLERCPPKSDTEAGTCESAGQSSGKCVALACSQRRARAGEGVRAVGGLGAEAVAKYPLHLIVELPRLQQGGYHLQPSSA